MEPPPADAASGLLPHLQSSALQSSALQSSALQSSGSEPNGLLPWRAISGDLGTVCQLARLEACERGEPAIEVWVFWGDARWSRAQLLGEMARGHWGMCMARGGDFCGGGIPQGEGAQGEGAQGGGATLGMHDDSHALWTSIERSQRLVYAPQVTEALP